MNTLTTLKQRRAARQAMAAEKSFMVFAKMLADIMHVAGDSWHYYDRATLNGPNGGFIAIRQSKLVYSGVEDLKILNELFALGAIDYESL